MNRVGKIAGVLLVCAAAPVAQAQNQYVPPQVSSFSIPVMVPYGNLLRGGTVGFNPLVNYLTSVQPQLQTQAMFQQLQSELVTRTATVPLTPPRNTGLADTGYSPVRFLSYPQYNFTLSSPNRTSFQTTPGTSATSYGQR
jgi:hypothetical protein